MEYLEFKTVKCKDCFKCLRECPVKAIKYENHQAKIVEDRCILCGRCTEVCPQNAKRVHSEIDDVRALLESGGEVIASVAPSFVSSFGVQNFSVMRTALKKLGFDFAEETAVGANAVTEQYNKLLKSGEYRNFITSACPAINRMIQIYYPKALKYLAPVASPMVAHAIILKKRFPDAKIVFIGPCIAKKREARESGIIDGVLTFEDLLSMFETNGINLEEMGEVEPSENAQSINIAKSYPISNGIIKSFVKLPDGYEYVAVDGVRRTFDLLQDIDSLSGMFLEVNCCEYACINGPCAIKHDGGPLKANEDIRKYVNRDLMRSGESKMLVPPKADLMKGHPHILLNYVTPSERDIKAVLEKTGKFSPEDELNCGACGYSTCREKAIAVINGYADIEMCIPYMRTRAESMSYEIIQNSPNGIIVMENDYKILEVNEKARKLLGINEVFVKGKYAFDCFDANEFVLALTRGRNVHNKKVKIEETKKYVEVSIILLDEHKVMFGVYKDITDRVEYDKELAEVKAKTLDTTDEVIKKQMRVAQEIASLLGETTAETKVALLKLKKTLQPEDDASDK